MNIEWLKNKTKEKFYPITHAKAVLFGNSNKTLDEEISDINNSISSHTSNTSNPHSVTKAQVGLGNVENKSSATIRGEITKSNVTTALGYTPYTPNEIDNKFSALETNIDWKESVSTFDDIATAYPNPVDGWTVNVKDTDYTYRYNGTSWVAISANAIPKATNSVDGLLSKEDHANYEDANSKKHTHSNKSVIDGISSTNVSNWNSAKTHADSTHARTDATKVEASSTNGNIKINGTETTVYTHPSGTNPHGTTKSDVGLGNVGNFKAVSTVASQGLSDTEKSNARANIGAGTSSFSGSYNDLSNKPTIGNGTVTIKQAGTSKGTFTMNQSGNTTIELTDNNTTYSSKSAASGGTDVSLVTTGEKYTWNNKSDLKIGTTSTTAAAGNHTHSSYVNQNAFSNVVVGSTTITADSATDTLTLVAGTNITLTPDATNDKITISSSGGTSYTLPVATSSALGGVKSGTDITVDSSGNVSVNDDSHNHVISNVDGLQSALDGKAASSHTHSYLSNSNPTGTGSFSLNRKNGSTVGSYSFAEGFNTTASKVYSHAEGGSTTASGVSSHAEGSYTIASGDCSHAEGSSTTASGVYSHAEGCYTIASGDYQHVQGKYNIEDTTSAFIIGNGTNINSRSNAMTVDWNGNVNIAGDITNGSGISLNSLNSNLLLRAYAISHQADIPTSTWTNVLEVKVKKTSTYLISWCVAFKNVNSSSITGSRVRSSSTITNPVQYVYSAPSGVNLAYGECYITELNENETVYIDVFSTAARNCSNKRVSLIPLE